MDSLVVWSLSSSLYGTQETWVRGILYVGDRELRSGEEWALLDLAWSRDGVQP
jgi:hypothetical protein